MIKKLTFLGALAAFGSVVASAATATVWDENGAGDKVPAYWYPFNYGTGSSIDVSASTESLKVIELAAKSGSTSNGAGYGFGWEQGPAPTYADVAVSLAAYKGVCLTYKASAPLRVDFKQSTIKDDNYYGAELTASEKFKRTFLAFANLKQGWSSTTKVAWSATLQTGVQFSYKNTHATATVNTNRVEISSFILADACPANPPVVSEEYKTKTAAELYEGDTLAINLAEVFTDPDGDDLTYSAKVVSDVAGSVKLADTLYNKTKVLKVITGKNPSGDALLTLTASDETTKATHEIIITAIDRENAPVAVPDNYKMNEDEVLKVGISSSVIKNDYDIDGDNFSIANVTEPEHGVLVFDKETGTFTYTPNKDYFGTDEFTYTIIEDSREDATYEVKESLPAKVTITISNVDDPIEVVIADSTFSVDSDTYALGDTIQVDEDFGVINISIPGESIQFIDPDALGDPEVEVKSSGIVKADYTFFKKHIIELTSIDNANGLAVVNLFAADGKDTVSVKFYVNVAPVKDAPIAVDDTYKVIQDSLNNVKAANGVLKNDLNPDGKSTLKAYLKTNASEGQVKLAEDGSFTYEAGHFEGEDSFTYYIVNAEGDTSEVATVTLNVAYKNQAPTLVEGVADTVGNKLSNLIEDFTSTKSFSLAEMRTWFVDDTDAATKFTFTVRSEDSLLAPTINATTKALQIKSVKNACGDAIVILTVKDSEGASAELEIPASITCVNDKPVLLEPETLFVASKNWKDTVDLYDYIMDPDGDNLTFTVTPTEIFNKNFDLVTEDNILTISLKDSADFGNLTMTSISVKAADSLTYVNFKIILVFGDKTSIAPKIAKANATWQNAILSNKGVATLFDMQGRVIWKQNLPSSEAEVLKASAAFNGQKILRINKQMWTIK